MGKNPNINLTLGLLQQLIEMGVFQDTVTLQNAKEAFKNVNVLEYNKIYEIQSDYLKNNNEPTNTCG